METRELVLRLGKFIAPVTSSVSSACRNSSKVYIDELKKNHRWAVAMYDAGARPNPGILEGNINSLGFFDECINLNEYENISAQFCISTLTLQSTNTSTPMEEVLATKGISWGICLPTNCTISDIKTGFNEWMKDWNIVARSVHCQDSHLPMDATDWFAVIILIALAFCVLLSTTFDYYTGRYKSAKHRNDCLTSFSLLTNGYSLFQRASDTEILCLYGIRFLSILWILFGHVIFVETDVPAINVLQLSQMSSRWIAMPVISATLAVDTFLMMSGLLAANKFLKKLERDTSLKQVTVLTIPILANRYIRIAPAVAILILLQVSLWRHFGSGPLWSRSNNYLVEFCQENWYWALLFVQNYVSGNRMCFGHSWYLNVDMQLFLLSPLLITPMLYWREWACLLMFGCLIFSGFLIGFLVNYINEFPAGLLVGDIRKRAEKNQFYYIATHTRFAPYIIGIAVGYLIHKHKETQIIFPTFFLYEKVVLWILATAAIIYGIFGVMPFQLPDYIYEPIGASVFTAALPIIWTLGVAWIVLACELEQWPFLANILGTSKFHALARLTYCIYLVHLPIMQMRASIKRVPMYFNFMDVMVDFFGDCILSILFAALLYLGVERPFIKFGKILADCVYEKFGGELTTEKLGPREPAPAAVPITEMSPPGASSGVPGAGSGTTVLEVVLYREPDESGAASKEIQVKHTSPPRSSRAPAEAGPSTSAAEVAVRKRAQRSGTVTAPTTPSLTFVSATGPQRAPTTSVVDVEKYKEAETSGVATKQTSDLDTESVSTTGTPWASAQASPYNSEPE